MLQEIQPQETEVVAKAKRRTFTAKYKREIVRQADACKEPGAIGMLLRREGLYSSHLTVWRREIAERELSALAPKKRGPKAKSIDPREQELAVLRRQLAVSNARAERAELLVEIQKKSRCSWAWSCRRSTRAADGHRRHDGSRRRHCRRM